MTYDDICAAVKRILRKYDERDPFRLCTQMGILLRFESFGTDEYAIKGFFVEFSRIPCITINSDLPKIIQKIILSHELGHAVLHRKSGVYAFHDVGLFDESAAMEKEANLFAAEYLLDDDEVLGCLNSDSTFFQAAAELCVPAELLDFKFRLMKWKGYKLAEPPVNARGNFLKNMEIPENADYNS